MMLSMPLRFKKCFVRRKSAFLVRGESFPHDAVTIQKLRGFTGYEKNRSANRFWVAQRFSAAITLLS
jgi:hypothetical protein